MRLKLTIEYDGTPYAGWQRQNNILAVQQTIEDALANVFQTDVPITVAGRTDAGVHALGQVVHLDLPEDHKNLGATTLPKAINAWLLDQSVVVLHAEQVEDDFHARFSAVNKLYRYIILNRQAKPAIEANRVWHVRPTLDDRLMHEAAQPLLGRHDFTSFRDSECQAKSPVKTLTRLDVFRDGDHVVVEAEGKSFLHHQVRNMVGTLVQIGLGKEPMLYAKTALEARDRTRSGPTAPPQGLYLVRVEYPETAPR